MTLEVKNYLDPPAGPWEMGLHRDGNASPYGKKIYSSKVLILYTVRKLESLLKTEEILIKELQSVTKYYGNLEKCVSNSRSPPIQCCEPITQIDASLAHCFSTLLREGTG